LKGEKVNSKPQDEDKPQAEQKLEQIKVLLQELEQGIRGCRARALNW